MKTSKTKLGYKERDALFQKYFMEFKIKVALNWFELIALLVVSFFISKKLINYIGIDNGITNFIIAILTSVTITLIFSYIRKYKLTINRFDKERIYKRVSSELLSSKPD